MSDPVSITLSSVGLFMKFFDGFRRAYAGYKLTTMFGQDFAAAQRRFGILHTRLETVATVQLSSLENDVLNEGTELNKAIIGQLALISRDYEHCTKLIEKYSEKEKELEKALEAEAAKNEQVDKASIAEFHDSSTPNNRRDDDSMTKKKKSSNNLFKKVFRKKKPTKELNNTAATSAQDQSDSGFGNSSGSSSTSDIARSGTSTATTATPSHASQRPSEIGPAVLQSTLVQERADAIEEDATTAQELNNLWNRAKWADHDRDDFNTWLDQLRKDIIDLEAMIRLKVPRDPSTLLLQANFWPDISKHEDCQLALKALHDAMASVNPRSSPVELSVQIVEDPEEQADEFSTQEDSPSFAAGSLMFVFQAQISGSLPAPSLFVYAEAFKGAASQDTRLRNSTKDTRLHDISEALSKIDFEDQSENCRALGYVSRGDSTARRHHLISPAVGSWVSTQTLETFLRQTNFETKLTRLQRFQMARLLAVAFLHFAKVISTSTQYPRPNCVRFYRPKGEKEAWLSASSSEPLVLSPYISIGFGARKSGKLPGLSSGLAKETVNPVFELGLILYQVGSARTLDYGNGIAGLNDARNTALKSIHLVDGLSNGSFAELVQVCLGWRGSIHAPVERSDYVFIHRVRHWLKKQEDDMGI